MLASPLAFPADNMSLFSCSRLLQFQKRLIIPTQYAIQVNNYADPGMSKMMKKGGKKMQVVQKREIPVETDVNKLLTYVCGSNIYKEGEDVKLKPDSEYPDWLWTLKTEQIRLEDLDPNTKQYWRHIRKHGIRRHNHEKKYKKF